MCPTSRPAMIPEDIQTLRDALRWIPESAPGEMSLTKMATKGALRRRLEDELERLRDEAADAAEARLQTAEHALREIAEKCQSPHAWAWAAKTARTALAAAAALDMCMCEAVDSDTGEVGWRPCPESLCERHNHAPTGGVNEPVGRRWDEHQSPNESAKNAGEDAPVPGSLTSSGETAE
jgi:hypothetical protein